MPRASSNRGLWPRVAASAIASLLAGCAAEQDEFRVVWSGDLLEVLVAGEPPSTCGGTYDYMDDHLRIVGEQLGVTEPERVYYHYGFGGSVVAENCDGSVEACAIGSDVFTATLPDEHELTHAVRPSGQLAYLPVEEGLAEFFGSDVEPIQQPVGNVLELLQAHEQGEKLDRPFYQVMGHFVSYLAYRFGFDRVAEFARESVLDEPFLAMQEKFAAVFGADLESIVVDHAGSTACNRAFYRVTAVDCARDVRRVLTQGDTAQLDLDLDCNSDDVIGPRDGERWRRDVVELAVGGWVLLDWTRPVGTEAAHVRMRPCDSGCDAVVGLEALSFEVPPEQPGGSMACLSAGRHVIRTAVGDEDTGGIILSLTVLGPAPDCGG